MADKFIQKLSGLLVCLAACVLVAIFIYLTFVRCTTASGFGDYFGAIRDLALIGGVTAVLWWFGHFLMYPDECSMRAVSDGILQSIYDKENLAERGLDPSSAEKPYTAKRDFDLADVYAQIDRNANQAQFVELLGEIKKRVESAD